MLDLWLLNVGHGDSIVLRVESNGRTAFGVVDSNCPGGGNSRALEKLRQLGAERLSFLVLTHPHDDHYSGLLQILKAYRGQIDHLYTFPMSNFLNGKRLDHLAALFKKAINNSDGSVKNSLAELLELLVEAKEQRDNKQLQWNEAAGAVNKIFPPGFEELSMEALMPLPKFKGNFYKLLDDEKINAISGPVPNAMSVVLRVTIANTSVILGADATHNSWSDHRKLTKYDVLQPQARVVKIPHHGSKHDVKAETLSYYFGSDATQERIALISADGRRHPHPEVLSLLQSQGIKPYCTNLAKVCGARKVDAMFIAPDVPREVARIINAGDVELTSAQQQPCQGEIHVHIDNMGEVTVTPEFQHPCGYRGDYQRLGLA